MTRYCIFYVLTSFFVYIYKKIQKLNIKIYIFGVFICDGIIYWETNIINNYLLIFYIKFSQNLIG